MKNILVLRNIKASKVQAVDTLVTGYGPKLTAALGFLSFLNFGNKLTGFSYIHHDRELIGVWDDGDFLPAQKRGAWLVDKRDYPKGSNSLKNVTSLSHNPDARMNLEISLVAVYDQEVNAEELYKKLENARFSGAVLMTPPAVDIVSSLSEAQALIRSGFYVVRRDDLIQENKIESFVSALNFSEDAFLSPAVFGYALLEDPVQRTGAYENKKHALSEPLLGLCQYQSVRSSGLTLSDSLFWPIWTHSDVYELTQVAFQDTEEIVLEETEDLI